jgi:23S rRNA A2030 N6-methylase RlmJ
LQIQSGSPDFFFIDPPYVDDQDWILTKRLVKSLQKTNIKWAVWYPLFTHMESVFNQYTTIELHQKESDKIYGCGIAFGNFKKNWR